MPPPAFLGILSLWNARQAAGRVTIREADGKTYEFHANQDTLQTLKVATAWK
jgi:hypothetical protein